MSDNWVVQNLQNALDTWNSKLSEIWQLLTTSPQEFKGGSIWNVMVTINGAVQAIGLALLVLFFVVGVVRTCGSFTEVKKPEHALKLFIRFAIAKGVITYGLELMLALFNIVQGTISTIMTSAALTRPEQDLFLDYLKTHPVYEHWYPVFAVMIGTGLRVGEVTGLRWCDIDMKSGMIDVNHTLVYYDHRTEGSKKGCYFNVNTTKTPASMRQVPMLDFVKEAFELEKQKQKDLDIHCEVTIDGYSDFIFINRFGQAQHQATLNKAIRRIIRDCNDEQFEKSEEPEVLLPHFSCHSLRHTFTTRMCEAGVNIKVIQDALGHTDISTTLNIYTDVTKELKTSEFKGLDNYFKAQ